VCEVQFTLNTSETAKLNIAKLRTHCSPRFWLPV